VEKDSRPPDIAEVVEFSARPLNDVRIPNAYLAAGWVLLGTYVTGNAETGQTHRYCLGWPKSRGPVAHPEAPVSAWDEMVERLANEAQEVVPT